VLRCIIARLSLSAAFLPLIRIREARARRNERKRKGRTMARNEGMKVLNVKS